MASGGAGEPSTAPLPDRWYTLRLGSSFKDDRPSSKFCTLRYEFQPASIDKSQSGSLHKSKENRITVEFQNNQPGKPKVAFEGTSEECRDNDGILFFDGQTFRLEKLHRAVKRLRHVRKPGESAAASSSSSAPAAVITSSSAAFGTESRSPPLSKPSKLLPLSKSLVQPLPLEVERIDIGESDDPSSKIFDKSTSLDALEQEENADLSDNEIADVDLSDDDHQQGPNAAEALRAQATGNSDGNPATSSSSGSSGSGSSDSDTDGSDDNSSSSAADEEIDIDGI